MRRVGLLLLLGLLSCCLLAGGAAAQDNSTDCHAPPYDDPEMRTMTITVYTLPACGGEHTAFEEVFLDCVCFKRPARPGLEHPRLPPSVFNQPGVNMSWWYQPNLDERTCLSFFDPQTRRVIVSSGECVDVAGLPEAMRTQSVRFTWSAAAAIAPSALLVILLCLTAFLPSALW